MSLKLAVSTERVLGQPKLHGETPSHTNKQTQIPDANMTKASALLGKRGAGERTP